MAWSTIRRATDDDIDTLNERAQTFAERHGIELPHHDPDGAGNLPDYYGLDTALSTGYGMGRMADSPEYMSYLARLWKRIVNRALGTRGCDGIAYGYVGSHQD